MEQSNQIEKIYNLIISKVDEHNLISIIQHFTEIFKLQREPAEQILKSAPIVFLQGLDKNSLKMLKGRLIFLSKMGVEFLITTQLSTKIPCVIWSGKSPNYIESSSGELIKSVDFQWSGNAFVCPNCSETFVFKRIGNPLTTSVKVVDDISKYIDTSGGGRQNNRPVQARSVPTDSVGRLSKNIHGKVDDTNESDVLEIQSLQSEGSSEDLIEFPQSHEELNNSIPQEETFIVDDNKPQEDIEIPEPILEPIAELVEGLQQNIKPAPQEKANCAVFLTSIPPDKKVKAVGLIAKLKGVSIQEAQLLTTRLLVPVMKDITKSVAIQSLEEFKKIGVKGRITVKI
ncbi:MAG: hypothetical protein V1709_09090 [Planctomycetota bacterium]